MWPSSYVNWKEGRRSRRRGLSVTSDPALNLLRQIHQDAVHKATRHRRLLSSTTVTTTDSATQSQQYLNQARTRNNFTDKKHHSASPRDHLERRIGGPSCWKLSSSDNASMRRRKDAGTVSIHGNVGRWASPYGVFTSTRHWLRPSCRSHQLEPRPGYLPIAPLCNLRPTGALANRVLKVSRQHISRGQVPSAGKHGGRARVTGLEARKGTPGYVDPQNTIVQADEAVCHGNPCRILTGEGGVHDVGGTHIDYPTNSMEHEAFSEDDCLLQLHSSSRQKRLNREMYHLDEGYWLHRKAAESLEELAFGVCLTSDSKQLNQSSADQEYNHFKQHDLAYYDHENEYQKHDSPYIGQENAASKHDDPELDNVYSEHGNVDSEHGSLYFVHDSIDQDNIYFSQENHNSYQNYDGCLEKGFINHNCSIGSHESQEGDKDHLKFDKAFKDCDKDPLKFDKAFKDNDKDHLKFDKAFKDCDKDHLKFDKAFKDSDKDHLKFDKAFKNGYKDHLKFDKAFKNGYKDHLKFDKAFKDSDKDHLKFDKAFKNGYKDHLKFDKDHLKFDCDKDYLKFDMASEDCDKDHLKFDKDSEDCDKDHFKFDRASKDCEKDPLKFKASRHSYKDHLKDSEDCDKDHLKFDKASKDCDKDPLKFGKASRHSYKDHLKFDKACQVSYYGNVHKKLVKAYQSHVKTLKEPSKSDQKHINDCVGNNALKNQNSGQCCPRMSCLAQESHFEMTPDCDLHGCHDKQELCQPSHDRFSSGSQWMGPNTNVLVCMQCMIDIQSEEEEFEDNTPFLSNTLVGMQENEEHRGGMEYAGLSQAPCVEVNADEAASQDVHVWEAEDCYELSEQDVGDSGVGSSPASRDSMGLPEDSSTRPAPVGCEADEDDKVVYAVPSESLPM